MKDLKVGGKKLPFDVVSISIKTEAGFFLTNKVPRQPFAIKICVQKQFSRKHQTYIQVTMCDNTFGVRKYDYFVKFFREMITVIVAFEPSLVVIQYLGGERLT